MKYRNTIAIISLLLFSNVLARQLSAEESPDPECLVSVIFETGIISFPHYMAEATLSIELVDNLKGLHGVVFVTSNRAPPRLQEVTTEYVWPNDPDFFYQWNLRSPYDINHGINALKAWEVTTGSSSTKVAIIDTGLNLFPVHQDLYVPGRVSGDPFWLDDPQEQNYGHGDTVAGILGAIGNNGFLIAGVNWNTKMHIENHHMDSHGNRTRDVLLSIYRSIMSDAEIINVSIAATDGIDLDEAAGWADAYKSNILTVAPMGNNGTCEPVYPHSLANGQIVMGVGAVDEHGERKGYSSYGVGLSVMAPTGVRTLKPGGGETHMGGTCASAAHVSGAASLLLAIKPDLYNDDLRRLIEVSAVPMTPDGDYDQLTK